MYSYIKGTLEGIEKDYIVVDAGGIGYKIFTPESTIRSLNLTGEKVKIYTYLHVREDNLSLFGFLTYDEQRMFELLISVSGIGPKVANSVLSNISPSRFCLAVISDDINSLTNIPGIGKKTAQRVILELKDKLKTQDAIDKSDVITDVNNNDAEEIVDALKVLGYQTREIILALQGIDTNLPIEEVIKQTLKKLAR